MKAGNLKIIENMDDWLPPYGENSVHLETINGDLLVKVLYDSNENTAAEITKKIFFLGAASFYKTVTAGPDLKLLNIEYTSTHAEEVGSFGAIVEYTESGVTAAWAEYYNKKDHMRHYRIFFEASNILLIVFARDIRIE